MCCQEKIGRKFSYDAPQDVEKNFPIAHQGIYRREMYCCKNCGHFLERFDKNQNNEREFMKRLKDRAIIEDKPEDFYTTLFLISFNNLKKNFEKEMKEKNKKKTEESNSQDEELIKVSDKEIK